MLRSFNNNYEVLGFCNKPIALLAIENSYRLVVLKSELDKKKTETNLHEVRGWKYRKQK